MKDYRLLENRKECFFKYYEASLRCNDFDPWFYMANYIQDKTNMSIEQRYWFSWLYVTSYNGITSWVFFNEFPELNKINLEKFQQWEEISWRKMEFDSDSRFNKGKIHILLKHYIERLGGKSQEEYFKDLLDKKGNKVQSFNNFWNDVIKNFKFFGRWMSFCYAETLYRCLNYPIECNSLFLDDIGGSRSHRDGLCFLLGKDDWDDHHPNFKGYTKEMISYLVEEGNKLMEESKKVLPQDLFHMVEYFTLETVLCVYKKFFRQTRYLGYYLDRTYHQIVFGEKQKWKNVDWKLFWDCRKELTQENMLCENLSYKGMNKEFMKEFMNTGRMINFDKFFDEDKDEYELF